MPKTFDVDALISELELDQEDIVELFDDFKEFIEETMPELKKSIESSDMGKARSQSHSIKGSAGNLRINEVYEISKRMQDEAENSDSSGLEADYVKLEAAVAEFLEELTSL